MVARDDVKLAIFQNEELSWMSRWKLGSMVRISGL